MKINSSYIFWIATLIISGFALSSQADTDKQVNAPGFRPETKAATKFLEHLDSSRIVVLPTVIRTKTTTTHSKASQGAVVDFLKEHKLGIPEAGKGGFDMGELNGKSQFEWFQNDQKRLGEFVRQQSGADYYLTLEYLIPKTPSGEAAVFGVHIYVLDADGKNAFSFLLNSHHKVLGDAGLKSADASEPGLESLVLKGDNVALDALLEQIKQARQGLSK